MEEFTILARDDYPLAARLFGAPEQGMVVMNSAMAVDQRFYRRFAAALSEAGYGVLTYDYRGVAKSAPRGTRRSEAQAVDWPLLDMSAVVDWASKQHDRVVLVGHSFGGQTAGLIDNAHVVTGMVTISSQSGYWRLQGGEQKLIVWIHTHLTLPGSAALFGYLPWSKTGGSADLPKGVAQDWARWGRSPGYLLDDTSLPLGRFAEFTAPVLALSIGDDKRGRPEAVDAMMSAYPNLERRHIEPADVGLEAIGHMGYFKQESAHLWPEIIEWMNGL